MREICTSGLKGERRQPVLLLSYSTSNAFLRAATVYRPREPNCWHAGDLVLNAKRRAITWMQPR